MAERFEFYDNPLASVILGVMMKTDEYDLPKKVIEKLIYEECYSVVNMNYDTINHVDLFDFNIKFDKSGDAVKIIPNNMTTALWFINIYPSNPKDVNRKKKFKDVNGEYVFRNNKLTLNKYE